MTPEEPRKSTILIIEDYADNRILLASLLRNYGYDVIQAENGKEGVSEAERRHPDLILMDLAMPEMDGVEAMRRIRQVPGLEATPIFVISAYMTDAVRSDAFVAGCTETLMKPLDPNLLLEKIKTHLG